MLSREEAPANEEDEGSGVLEIGHGELAAEAAEASPLPRMHSEAHVGSSAIGGGSRAGSPVYSVQFAFLNDVLQREAQREQSDPGV